MKRYRNLFRNISSVIARSLRRGNLMQKIDRHGLRRGLAMTIIILFAIFLRFFRLGSNPVSLDWDEVSLGYNAWSILETGHDEFGNSFPLTIRSFGDYKPPAYAYLLVPVLKIFGRTEFAIRFPSALAGVLTVAITYFLTRILFESSSTHQRINASTIGLIASLFLAINPWHLQFSRVAFEANVGLFFSVCSIYCFFCWIRKKIGVSLVLSSFSFALALETYHSFRVFLPILFLFSVFLWRKAIAKRIRQQPVITAISVCIIVGVLAVISYTIFIQKVGQARFKTTSIFAKDNILLVGQTRVSKEGSLAIDLVANLPILSYGKEFFSGYFSHYNLQFLFIDGDSVKRHHAPDVALLYWIELPLLAMGLLWAVREAYSGTYQAPSKFLLAWFLLAPIASSLAQGAPSAVRSITFLPVLQIFSAIGVTWCIDILKSKNFFKPLLIVFCSLFLVEVFYYLHQYYVHGPIEQAKDWQYGYKQLVQRVMQEKDSYDRIVVTTAYDQPYIYFLWYGNYDPKTWINNGEFDKGFDTLQFRRISDEVVRQGGKTLIVGSSDEMSSMNSRWGVQFPDGSPAFVTGAL